MLGKKKRLEGKVCPDIKDCPKDKSMFSPCKDNGPNGYRTCPVYQNKRRTKTKPLYFQ